MKTTEEKAKIYASYIASNSFGNYIEDYKDAYEKFMNASVEEQNIMYFWAD